MKISVIIPTYNRAKLLPRALHSVLKQSYKAEEILIIDDGSSDNTEEVLQAFMSHIRYIKQENSGVSAARNKGIELARCEWVAFLDSDDEWHTDKLQKQVDLYEQNPNLAFIHTGEQWIRNNKKVSYPRKLQKPSGWCFLENTATCKIAASSVLMKKALFEELGDFNKDLLVCEDYDMWLRIAYSYELGLVDEELISKYAGHAQLSNSIFAIDAYHIDILERFLDSKHADEISKVIDKKRAILLKGAKKHQNEAILKKYGKN